MREGKIRRGRDMGYATLISTLSNFNSLASLLDCSLSWSIFLINFTATRSPAKRANLTVANSPSPIVSPIDSCIFLFLFQFDFFLFTIFKHVVFELKEQCGKVQRAYQSDFAFRVCLSSKETWFTSHVVSIYKGPIVLLELNLWIAVSLPGRCLFPAAYPEKFASQKTNISGHYPQSFAIVYFSDLACFAGAGDSSYCCKERAFLFHLQQVHGQWQLPKFAVLPQLHHEGKLSWLDA